MLTSPWRIRLDNLTLEHEGGYYVDLGCCQGPSQMLDWIMQVAKKTWADDRTIAELVRKLNLCMDPQGTMCSGAASDSDGVPSAVLRVWVSRRLAEDEMLEVSEDFWGGHRGS